MALEAFDAASLPKWQKLAADPDLQKKDAFETGKAFRERVAGGGFTKPASKTGAGSDDTPDAEPTRSEDSRPAETPVEPAPFIEEGEPISAISGEIADDEPGEAVAVADDGKGERDEA